MTYSPLISVVIPFLDSDFGFFKSAIYSVLSQTYENWEVIIINDGSTDENSVKLENFISSINDKRFLIIHLDKNCGPSYARNKGIDIANGEIIAFLDADDFHLPWYYKEIVDLFSKNPTSLILATPTLHYFPNKKKIYLDRHRHKLLENPEEILFQGFKHYPILSKHEEQVLKTIAKKSSNKIMVFSTPRLAIKKEAFKITRFDPNFVAIEDTEFCLSIINKPELLEKVIINPNFGYLYRIYSLKTRHTRKTNLNFEHMAKIVNKYSDKKSLAYDLVTSWKKRNDWKYCNIISKILNAKSKLESFKIFYTTIKKSRRKFNTLVDLIKLIVKHKVFSEKLGIDFRMFEIPSSENIDKTTYIKGRFETYLSQAGNETQKAYARKLVESIF